MNIHDEFVNIHHDDLWVYNKFILSRKLGYNCGPSGVPVSKSDFFIVRPCMNFMGMGRFARIEYLENDTEHLHPGEFWCEIFNGDHISVDYSKKTPVLSVKGYRDSKNPLYKWDRWEKINDFVEFPNILNNLKGDYDFINCEFIGDKLIEVHFRQNPDFKYQNSIAIPIWNDSKFDNDKEYKYIIDEDYYRKGFLID